MRSAPKPLQDLTVLVACSAKKMAEFISGLSAMGGTVLPFPVIEAVELEDKNLLDRSLDSLEAYDWILFTSAYAVRFFMQRLNERTPEAAGRKIPKLCALGPATASELRELGYEASLVPERFLAEGLLEALEKYYGGIQKMTGKRLLLPRALKARELLPAALTEAGAQVDVVPCYQTVRGKIAADVLRRLREKDPDLLVFTSSSTIGNFLDTLGPEEGQRMLHHSTVAAIGPITGDTAKSYGKIPEITPQESTVASLMDAIGRYYESKKICH